MAIPQEGRPGIVAPHGEKTVVVRVRFFTNDIAKEDGHIVPGHIWSGGRVEMEANEAHGIASDSSQNVPFQTLAEIPAAIEETLRRFGMRVHPAGTLKKILADDEIVY
jgi:hypothetical protein